MTDRVLAALDCHLEAWGGDRFDEFHLRPPTAEEWARLSGGSGDFTAEFYAALEDEAVELITAGDITTGDLDWWLQEQGVTARHEIQEFVTGVLDRLHENRRWERADYYYDLWKEG
jgi:hypothetical protein